VLFHFSTAGATADGVCATGTLDHVPGAQQTTLTCQLRPGVAGSSTAAAVTSFYGVSHPFVLSYGPLHCFNGGTSLLCFLFFLLLFFFVRAVA
jgi:hypothetical protein